MRQALKVISIRYPVAIVFPVLMRTLTSLETVVKVTLSLLFFAPDATWACLHTTMH